MSEKKQSDIAPHTAGAPRSKGSVVCYGPAVSYGVAIGRAECAEAGHTYVGDKCCYCDNPLRAALKSSRGDL